jgi:hypothetical protein
MAGETVQVKQANHELAGYGQEHSGAGRFNRRPFYVVMTVLITAGIVGMHGLHSAGDKVASTTAPPRADTTGDAERHQAEVASWRQGHRRRWRLPTAGAAAVIPIPRTQRPLTHEVRTPSRYAQLAEDKYASFRSAADGRSLPQRGHIGNRKRAERAGR